MIRIIRLLYRKLKRKIDFKEVLYSIIAGLVMAAFWSIAWIYCDKPTRIETVETPLVEQHEIDTVSVPEIESLGIYKITYYCPCEKCCGKSDGITASGALVTADHTVAADGFEFGTQLMINGTIYTVEDRGGAIKGNRIDIFCNTHEEALEKGIDNYEVYLIK